MEEDVSMDNKKILEILSDQAFFTNIISMKTPEQVQDAFLEKNIKLSIEEIKVLGDLVNLIRKQKSQPLSEAELDNVSGGVVQPSSTENDQPALPNSSMNTISGSEEAIAMLGGAIVGAANLEDKENQKKEILWTK